MTDAEAASGVVDSVHFSFYTSEEIRKISVKKITKPNLLDAKNSPVPDGLYDPALGPLNDTDSDDAERLAAKLRRVSVADVVERMEVCTVPFSIHGNQISTIYKLKMTLYPSELYPSFSELTLEDCREVLETTFVEAMEEAIAKHVDTIFKISDIKVVSGKEENDFKEGVDEDESRNKSSMVEENADGGDEDDESGDDQGTDSKRRKQQANDEVEYDDGIEKESFVAAGEHDEETRSGFESDIDHVEADEDYLMGGGSPGFDMDLATPESPSKADSTPISEDDKKKSKSVEKGKKETKSKAKKPKSSKKKIRRTIHVMAEGLKFEVHYISRSEPRILLAEIAQRTAKHVYVKEYKNIESVQKGEGVPFIVMVGGGQEVRRGLLRGAAVSSVNPTIFTVLLALLRRLLVHVIMVLRSRRRDFASRSTIKEKTQNTRGSFAYRRSSPCN
ncbi:DNA-directed RNA polymerase, partial [Musa troglodytarum]